MLPSKQTNFSEWYLEVIRKAKMADYAPVKGCIVFMPQSYSIWERIQEIVNKEIKGTGHRNAYFPLFIPKKLLTQEAEHFEGFVPEVAWVTKGGNTELEEPLAIRPTSETIMYVMYKNWIQSYRDLPLLINQWCSVVRWETKATKPFLRTKEFLWQEGHTAHAAKEDADKEVFYILGFYKKMLEEYLAIPVLAGKKSESEKFAGALYTTAIEAMMPDGKALQAGTSHNLGQNFSKPFEISFIDEKEAKQFAWQTSWGVSTRLIGALIMVHGDDKGLVIPPKVAPIQAVIIPIYFKDGAKKVVEKAQEIKAELEKKGISAELDARENYTPGWKFNEWELMGVPVRIEIGPKDMEKKQAMLARRDTGEKKAVPEKEAAAKVSELLEDIQKSMFKKAEKNMKEMTTEAKDYSEFKKTIEAKGGFVKAGWCGSEECEEAIQKETTATNRIVLEEEKGKCVKCGKQGIKAYFAKAY